ncbi:SARP family transcriptional regulator [Nocardioides sp. MAH-18]|uniref:SARP family transcriptional regulator n=1 Tax=Nocardioides agri TaxID=2682843 RepID=A0A6L6Y220_9ACTN|nr:MULTISPECIES: tetratricopeptide repeat protein [unclassified Nocardioides]MBA2952483.1 SARP family transcriptional regulator [Nocardioides sp. CGMCC 1.13656]MVQ51645.1 SARP family transcriptional regulator [Nocardioides sp. MAH-18]
MADEPLTIRLLGRPAIERPGQTADRLRSRKSWALLAYLLLCEARPTRSQLAGMLFSEADDPLRALRWSLAEIRRCLGDSVSIDGDPVVLLLSEGVAVDVDLLGRDWTAAVEAVGLGAELLDGLVVRGAPAFESWLLYERRRIAAASEAILHEAALGLLARGALDRACGFAVRAAAMSPLDENHQALLIRLYRLMGDDAAAERQYAAWTGLLDTELGVAPGVTIEAAMRERPRRRVGVPTSATVEAAIESGSATIAAGAIEPGVAALRSAVRLADAGAATSLRSRSRQVLAEALIHSLRGLDEEGLAHLHEADRLAVEDDDPIGSALARAELGYVDFLRARYDRAERWLSEAMDLADGSPVVMAKAATYLGSVHSDTADYPRAIALLDEAGRLSREAGDPRREAYALCMKGRVELLRGDLDEADHHLTTAVALAERVHWLSFLPWPQAFQGEVCLARHEPSRAAEIFQQAFARACQLGDPCWEGITARGLALVADAEGDSERAFETLRDARSRGTRLADPYVWLDAHILDAMCDLGRTHGHPETRTWIDTLRELASRAGMRELTVRALLHSAARGSTGDADAADLLAAEIDNPDLHALIRATREGRTQPC